MATSIGASSSSGDDDFRASVAASVAARSSARRARDAAPRPPCLSMAHPSSARARGALGPNSLAEDLKMESASEAARSGSSPELAFFATTPARPRVVRGEGGTIA